MAYAQAVAYAVATGGCSGTIAKALSYAYANANSNGGTFSLAVALAKASAQAAGCGIKSQFPGFGGL